MAFSFNDLPPALQPAPFNPTFTARYNLAGISPEAESLPLNYAGNPPCPTKQTCSFLCTSCLAETDVWQCRQPLSWAITIDDGPTEFTPLILDALRQRNMTATFFVIGSLVIRYPENLLAIHRAGHQIGIHTWSHRALSSMTTEVIVSELEYTSMAIERVIGRRPRYVRPPYGDIDTRLRSILRAMDLIPVIWNVDTRDWSTDITVSMKVFQDFVNTRTAGNPGGLSLSHETSISSTAHFPLFLDIIVQARLNAISVATCQGDTQPYFALSSYPVSTTTRTSIASTTTSIASTTTSIATNIATTVTTSKKSTASSAPMAFITYGAILDSADKSFPSLLAYLAFLLL